LKQPVYMPKLERLNENDYKAWASSPYWSPFDGIDLSMGLAPQFDENITEFVVVEEAEAYERDYSFRWEIYLRANHANLIEVMHLPSRSGDGTISNFHHPAAFTKWAIEYLPSFPPGLYQAVKEKYPAEFEGGTPHKNVLQAEMSANSGARTSTGNAGSDAKWAHKYEIVRNVMDYLEKDGSKNCFCDHSQLAEYLYWNVAADSSRNPLFNYPDMEDQTLKKFIREGAKKFLDSHGLVNRIVGTKGYKKSEAHCEIHQ